MDRKFYLVKCKSTPGILFCEVSDGKLFFLSGPDRTGISSISGDPMPTLRKLGLSHFGKSSDVYVEEIEFKIGKYHPSIARPIFQNRESFTNIGFKNEINEVRQFEREIGVLVDELEECFDVVSLERDNFGAFGFVFQNIIHLSCIGVEALFVKVFQDNKVPTKRPTFNEFKKLNGAMKLSDYSVLLPKYPWIPEFAPFSKWASADISQVPSWQAANNQLKHAKRSNFKAANLYNAIESVCAFMVLYVAVFGDDVFSKDFEGDLQYFSLNKRPIWTPQQNYFCAHDGNWTPCCLML